MKVTDRIGAPRAATPREVDTRLAELYRDELRAERGVASEATGLHYALGERRMATGRDRHIWPTTDAQALAACRARSGERVPQAAGGYTFADVAARYERAVADLAAIRDRQKPLDDEFDRRGGWTRFFVVQQHNGHIHSSMDCSTCNRGRARTLFGWNPDLSGLTETEAVAKLGPTLCSVCFPSAPVEWLAGAVDDRCTAGIVDGSQRRGGRSTWADCKCGAVGVLVNASGDLRKHKPLKAADAHHEGTDAARPGDWRRALTLAEATDLFSAGAEVRHLNPQLSDWRGVVEPMPRAGRHIEGPSTHPLVRVRWEGDESPHWMAAECIERVRARA